MKREIQSLNYWPGYVDALMNIFLNLLFLVGLFIIGLICMNLEIMKDQEKLAALEAEERMLTAQSMVAAGTNQSPKSSAIDHSRTKDLAAVTEDIHLQRQSSVVSPINFSPAAESQLDNSKIKKLASQIVKGQLVTQVVFPEQTFKWMDNVPLPSLPMQTGEEYWLVNLTDIANPRLVREAYSRVMSLRSAYQALGRDVRRLHVRIAPIPADVSAVNNAYNTIFIVKQTRY